MEKRLFEALEASIQDAIAFGGGDSSRGRLQVVPNVAAIRQRIGLSQVKFAQVFGVPVGTLRGWEQFRRTPDGPALSLLRVIEYKPEVVLEALSRGIG